MSNTCSLSAATFPHHSLARSLVVLLGEPEVPEELGVNSFQGWVFVTSRFLDSISVSFHTLVVSRVVLGLGHLVVEMRCWLYCCCVCLISVTICSLIFFICPH